MSQCTAIQRHNLHVKLVFCPDVLPALQRQNLHVKLVLCPDVLPYRDKTFTSNLFYVPMYGHTETKPSRQTCFLSRCTAIQRHNLHVKLVFCPDVLPYRDITFRSNLFSVPMYGHTET